MGFFKKLFGMGAKEPSWRYWGNRCNDLKCPFCGNEWLFFASMLQAMNGVDDKCGKCEKKLQLRYRSPSASEHIWEWRPAPEESE